MDRALSMSQPDVNEARVIDGVMAIIRALSPKGRTEAMRRLGVIAIRMKRQSFRPSGYRLGVPLSEAARAAVLAEIGRIGKVAMAEKLGITRAVMDSALLRGSARSDTIEAMERFAAADAENSQVTASSQLDTADGIDFGLLAAEVAARALADQTTAKAILASVGIRQLEKAPPKKIAALMELLAR